MVAGATIFAVGAYILGIALADALHLPELVRPLVRWLG
jgi:hypothetical protein